MENNRLEEAEKSLSFWLEELNLHDWHLSIELADFKRIDYIQTGDFKIEDEKKAIILISKTPTDKEIHKVVLHEIIHILLWKLDTYCEEKIGAKNKKEYLSLLEDTVDILTKRFEK